MNWAMTAAGVALPLVFSAHASCILPLRVAALTAARKEHGLSFAQRWREVRGGFERPFWVANISEIFERLSYYAVFAALARYLHEALAFPADKAAGLSGIFGGAVWVM